jgi:hypothetical protein
MPLRKLERLDSHAVLAALLDGVLALGLVVDDNVEVARVALVRRDRDLTLDRLALLQRHHVGQVKDRFCGAREPLVSFAVDVRVRRAGLTLPVGVLGVRAGREADGLVACPEGAVEPAEERVDVCRGGENCQYRVG